MPAFDISTTDTQLKMVQGASGLAVFTVKSRVGRRVLARADLEPMDETTAQWLSIDGRRERAFAEGATETIRVVIAPPAEAPPGRYNFRVRMVATSESASELNQATEPITFEVVEAPRPAPPPELTPVPDPPKKRDRWLFVALALLALVIVLGLAAVVAAVLPRSIDCSSQRLSGAPGELAPPLGADQRSFEQPRTACLTGARFGVNIGAQGTVGITVNGSLVESLELTEDVGSVGFGTTNFNPPIGVKADATIRLDVGNCRNCSDLYVVLTLIPVDDP